MLRNPRPAQILRGKRLACGLIVLAAVIAAAAATGQTFRFRAAATRVIVDVLVLDDDGNPVSGLTAGDFELFEDGEPQRVASLDVVDWERYELDEAVPVEAEPSPAPAPDVETTGSGNASPRRFVIVFNRRRADPVNLRRAKRGLEEFVAQHMVDGDETMILEFAHTVRVLQEFYSGKEQTLANVRRIIPGTYESPVGPEIDARDSFQMLYALAEALERVEGRKIVVFLSMGLQTFADPRQVVGEIAGDEVDEFPGRRALDETGTLQAAIRQLNHANATLYAVDLLGVFGNENRILTPSLNAFDVLGNPIPVESSDHPLARMEVAANIPAEGGTASLAVATGGTYFPNQTNFAVALNRIGIQNQLYYLVSFSPAKTELDGEYRQIAVRVRDRPDLRVIARPGVLRATPRGRDRSGRARGLRLRVPGGPEHLRLPPESQSARRLRGTRRGAAGVVRGRARGGAAPRGGTRGGGPDRGGRPRGHPALLDFDTGGIALRGAPARAGGPAGRPEHSRRIVATDHPDGTCREFLALERLPLRRRGARTGSGRPAGEARRRVCAGGGRPGGLLHLSGAR